MKPTLLIALLSCATTGAFGQGWVQFRNYYTGTTPPVDAPVYIEGDGRVNGLDNPLARAALIGGPTNATPASWVGPGNLSMMFYPATSALSTISWVNFRITNGIPNDGGYVAYGSYVARAVPGVDWGGTALVQMVAWQGKFNTWQDAWTAAQTDPNVYIGFSYPLTLKLPSSPFDSNYTYLWGLHSFYIAPVLEPPPLLTGVSASGSDITLTWQSLAGRYYFVEYSTNLAPSPYFKFPIGRNIASGGSTTSWTHTNAVGDPMHFYRVGVQ